MEKFAAVYTLGCRLNSADSALVYNRLKQIGYNIVDIESEKIDLIVINSCAVTALAAKKSRQMAKKMRQKHPNAIIIGAGCSAKIDDWDNLANVVVKDKKNISDILQNFSNKSRVNEILQADNDIEKLNNTNYNNQIFTEENFGDFPFNSRAFIKIQEGCNNFCTYCIVPYVRGRERSRNFNEIILDVKHAVANDYPEIILTGVNSCAYNDNGKTLSDLLREVAKISGDFRIRLSSTEPKMDNMELLEVMAELGDKVCRFLHLSMQHGADEILKKMHRHYTYSEYKNFVDKARDLIPDIHIGTDIIVGFPQESEDNFLESCQHVQELEFANAHLFSYSKRAGTVAASMSGQIDKDTIKTRYNQLKNITDKSASKFAKSFIGRELPVIFEEIKKDGFAHGWSDNYLAVKSDKTLIKLEKITIVKIIKIDDNGILVGEIREDV